MRLKPYTEELPKPLMPVGGRPILWHIMKIYSSQGYDDFILCLGFKGEKIQEYFKNTSEDWNIVFVDTGLDTPTGERLKKVERHVDGNNFFATYGDGVANIDLKRILEFHLLKRKIATITAVRAYSPFGMLKVEDGHVIEFREKPLLDYHINGGFFVFRRDVFSYIEENDALEREVFDKLVKDGELCACKHFGFWRCVDTFKDLAMLNKMWENNPKWKMWRE